MARTEDLAAAAVVRAIMELVAVAAVTMAAVAQMIGLVLFGVLLVGEVLLTVEQPNQIV